jgi:hypothetical protein
MAKKTTTADGRIDLADGEWIELGALDDLPMALFAEWVEAEKNAQVAVVFSFLSQVVTAWSWPWPCNDPASFGKLKLGEYRRLSQAVTKRLQDTAGK